MLHDIAKIKWRLGKDMGFPATETDAIWNAELLEVEFDDSDDG